MDDTLKVVGLLLSYAGIAWAIFTWVNKRIDKSEAKTEDCRKEVDNNMNLLHEKINRCMPKKEVKEFVKENSDPVKVEVKSLADAVKELTQATLKNTIILEEMNKK